MEVDRKLIADLQRAAGGAAVHWVAQITVAYEGLILASKRSNDPKRRRQLLKAAKSAEQRMRRALVELETTGHLSDSP